MRSKSPIVLMLVGLIATGLPVVAEAQNAASVFELAGAEAKYTPGDFKPAPEKMIPAAMLQAPAATNTALSRRRPDVSTRSMPNPASSEMARDATTKSFAG